MFKLILGVDLRSECLTLEGVVKEFAAFVRCADNAESVANHLCAVALEGGCVLAAFATLHTFIFIGTRVHDLVDAVALFNRCGKSCAALAFKILFKDLICTFLRNEGEKINDDEKSKNRKRENFNSRINYRGRNEAETSKGRKSVSYRNYVHIKAEKLV